MVPSESRLASALKLTFVWPAVMGATGVKKKLAVAGKDVLWNEARRSFEGHRGN